MITVTVRDGGGAALADWQLPISDTADIDIACQASGQKGNTSNAAPRAGPANRVRLSVMPCLRDSLFTMWVMGEVEDTTVVARCGINGLNDFRDRLQAASSMRDVMEGEDDAVSDVDSDESGKP